LPAAEVAAGGDYVEEVVPGRLVAKSCFDERVNKNLFLRLTFCLFFQKKESKYNPMARTTSRDR
jgi:hypothetical protein